MTGAGETFVLVSGDDDVRLTSAPAGSAVPAGAAGSCGGVRPAGRDRGRDRRARADRRRGEEGLSVFEREPGRRLRAPPADPGGGLRRRRDRAARRRRRGRDLGLADLGRRRWCAPARAPSGRRCRVRRGPAAAARPRPGLRRGAVSSPTRATRRTRGSRAPRAALGADGRALLALGDRRTRACARRPSPPPGRPSVRRWRRSVRDQAGITPLVLADGRRAVAWTDNAPIFSGRRTPAGCTSRSRARPARRRRRRRRSRSARRATARCAPRSRSCCRCAAAPRATSAARSTTTRSTTPGLSLARAGTALLRFRPLQHAGRTRDGPGRCACVVRWSAPGSSAVRSVTEHVRLRRLPAPRLPRIQACARAGCPAAGSRCAGARTARPIDAYWYVYGTRVADPKRDGDFVDLGSAPAGDRRRHRVVLRGRARASVTRW